MSETVLEMLTKKKKVPVIHYLDSAPKIRTNQDSGSYHVLRAQVGLFLLLRQYLIRS